jgi:hypothetical protein
MFPGLPGGRLPPGPYTATLFATGITDSAGAQLDGNANGVGGDNFVLSFKQAEGIPGDTDGDGDVDLDDFSNLKIGFGIASGATLMQGDLDADGDVDLVDFNILKENFGAMSSWLEPNATTKAEEAVDQVLARRERWTLVQRQTAFHDEDLLAATWRSIGQSSDDPLCKLRSPEL